ncbi:sigma-E processing peptidase SpoIIGA [Aneurinibacillus thermoaerophilus]|uniref:sigma-E processing peptidase SpoIIGA n=1 Tax=Aneurinibacillus thermoaerophilus TaxID=143495 RepID=UPI002E1D43DA|nr:sigma-E processing peptidase SpoIIGA [Aneurinibacillus thermoaerophilus]MED0674713.1 sigma-E processing peptidase SpoIIGA [Aneurinibacillus thermoaerophilus]
MTVYADMVFVINMVIDYMLLFLTGHICRQPLRKRRLLLASAVGAAYTVFLFFPPLSFAFTFLAKFIFSCIMILLAFRWTRIWTTLRLLGAFYAVSFFIGGGLMATHTMLESKSEVVNGIVLTHTGSAGTNPTFLFIAFGFPIFWWCTRHGYYSVKANRQVDVQHVCFEVDVFGHTIRCRGFIDTGNQLHDPLSRIPVTIMEAELWKEVLPDGILRQIYCEEIDIASAVPDGEEKWLERMRFIPYCTVSSKASFLIAIRPDEVRVYAGNKTYRLRRMLIGLRASPLSADGSYQAVVHPKATAEKDELAS